MNGERRFINLPVKMAPDRFEKQVASKTTNDTKKYLESVESQIKAFQIQRASENKGFTIDVIREYVKNGFNTNYTMLELWESFFSNFQKKGTTPRNERKYELVIEAFFSNILPPNAQVSELTYLHIVQFERYLKAHFADSTAANMLSKFRSIVLFGMSIERITEDPFKGIHIKKSAKEVAFLNAHEVDAIRKKQMPNERLERVKDLFLFQCFTALSYCDMAALDPDDFQQNQFGQIYIEKHRAKTKVLFCTVLFEDAIEIARKYNFRLPVISNQRYNGYLKEIADLCGIDKTLHTHLGRHTAGCYLLNKGLPIEVVAKIMGHTNTRMTRHYAHLLRDTVFSSIAALENKT
jgi:site-specific recombinase XerD